MKRWGVLLVLSALFVGGAILSLLRLRPEPLPRPAVSLRDAAGATSDLDEFTRRLWIACFAADEEASGLLARLAAQTPGTPVVLLTAEAGGRVPESAAEGIEPRYGSGSDLDAVAASLGLSRPVGDDLLVTVVDRAGVPRRSLALAPDAGVDELLPIIDEVRFQRGLEARPRLHATLNGTSALLLFTGYLCIRRRWIAAHLTCMVLAGLVTSTFLVSYLYYHFHAGSVPYPGTGWTRPIYFGVLLSHTILAAFVVPLALGTYTLAALRRFARHRGVARWTLPIWLYVSVTGVLIYCMLYVWA